MRSNTLKITRPTSYRAFIYTLIIFSLLSGLGEFFFRSQWQQETFPSLSIDKYTHIDYPPAKRHFREIGTFVEAFGNPDCLFIGSSYVQVGINPTIFAEVYEEQTSEHLACYNLGMDASSASSSATMAAIFINEYHPSIIIWGTQAHQFYTAKAQYSAENRFTQLNWVQHTMGSTNLEGWLIENSHFYRFIQDVGFGLFPTTTAKKTTPSEVQRPELPRIVDISGYAPLAHYRDDSPLFQESISNNSTRTLGEEDFEALQTLIDLSLNHDIRLILVEMPLSTTSSARDAILDKVAEVTQAQGIPFLRTHGLAPLPPTAYSDTSHLHVSGSAIFSHWLGTQIGTAVAQGKINDVHNPIWSPTSKQWPEPDYNATIGLSETNYEDYQQRMAAFTLVPDNAIILNPSPAELDPLFIQAMLGFSIEWQRGIDRQQRESLFDLMTVLGMMQYPGETVGIKDEQLDLWWDSLEPAYLEQFDVDYILCREERANLTVVHCPAGIRDNPDYTLLQSWDYHALYERYALYQIANTQ